ncbi:hypothetical protein WJX77_008256 [Trebouxia sp. C0004]
MLRELAARQAYQRFDTRQSSLKSQGIDEAAESDSFGTKPPGSLTSDFIYVSDDFKVQTGAKLTENLFVGKPLGCGLQGGVFLLQDTEGTTDPNHVLKVVFKFGIGGLLGMTNLEREWRVGRQLALLTEPGASLPGFMGTGAGVITMSGHFTAIVLERIIGRDVAQPVAHFKIIDFGLADFRETFGAGYVTAKQDSLIHGQPHRQPSLQSLLAQQAADDVDGQHQRSQQSGLMSNSKIGWHTGSTPRKLNRKRSARIPAVMLPQAPPMERIYRYFWRQKGDVYALLWDMQRYIDGRVWPKEDELEVRLMMDLIHHVTGVRVTAWFAPPDKQPENGNLTFRDKIRFSMYGFWYRNEGLLHVLRIRSLRVRSFLSPANPGITAAEALTAPFFTFDQGDEGTAQCLSYFAMCRADLSQLMRAHPSEKAKLVHSRDEVYLSDHNVTRLITNLTSSRDLCTIWADKGEPQMVQGQRLESTWLHAGASMSSNVGFCWSSVVNRTMSAFTDAVLEDTALGWTRQRPAGWCELL